MLTISQWFFVGFIALCGIIIAVYCFCNGFNGTPGVITLVITVILVLVSIFGLKWYNTHTASGKRNYKDFQSEFHDGIEREITITAEDGREIFHYEGKVDIETVHEGNANYILFESEEGKRYIIYYGIQDTVLIIEK